MSADLTRLRVTGRTHAWNSIKFDLIVRPAGHPMSLKRVYRIMRTRVRVRMCVNIYTRAYVREGASRVTRYDVSRDNAGMQGDRKIRARRSGLRGANTLSYFAR